MPYLGAVVATTGVECRKAIDKKAPALIADMADDEKARTASLYNVLVQVLQKRALATLKDEDPLNGVRAQEEQVRHHHA